MWLFRTGVKQAKFCLQIMILALVSGTLVQDTHAQTLSQTREMGRIMLGVVKSDIKKNYYDATFHGVDLEARFKEADEKLKQASSLNEILATIAAAVMDLNDSHTYFIPPRRATTVEHGWQMQVVGANAYVVAVQPGSDAEAKGLKPGDRIVGIDGFAVTRTNLPSLQYILYLLSPRAAMKLVVEPPDSARRELAVSAKVHEGKSIINLQAGMASDRYDLIREAETLSRLYRHRYYELPDALVWKMPQFDLSESQIDELMDKAKKRKALVLDLRGNGGGSEATMLRLIGNIFDHDVTVGELKRRSESKPIVARTRGKDAFSGKLVVLIDAGSASAAEVFASVVQTEKRGTVIGDKSSGQVMRSKSYDHQLGQDLLVYYGMTITDADLIMSNGKSLEKLGVTPDERLLPTARDLKEGRDPVLSHAASLVGLAMTPEKAGQLFPVEWKK